MNRPRAYRTSVTIGICPFMCASMVAAPAGARGRTVLLEPCPDFSEAQKLISSDAAPSDNFGESVFIDLSVALVGSPFSDGAAGSGTGAAYVFRFTDSAWNLEQKLEAPDAAPQDFFGKSVALNGNVAVIGAHNDDCAAGSACGSAYVFRFNGKLWSFEQRLVAPDPGPTDLFGFSVAATTNLILVGAHRHDSCIIPTHTECGAAYVFRFNGASWAFEQKLVADDRDFSNEYFGYSVAATTDLFLIGAYNDGGNSHLGAAYTFRHNGSSWIQEQKLTAPVPQVGATFGRSVATDGDTVAVGEPLRNCVIGSFCGAIHVFRWTGSSWIHEQQVGSMNPVAFERIGDTVDILGQTLVSGTFYSSLPGGSQHGALYMFRHDGATWTETQKLRASDPESSAQFGCAVSLSGDTVLVGSRLDNIQVMDEGSAYVFSCDMASESIPTVSEWGIASMSLLLVCAGTMILRRPLSCARSVQSGR